jgi:hypothetical protein
VAVPVDSKVDGAALGEGVGHRAVGDLDGVGDSNAEQPAPRPRRDPAFREAGPIRQREGVVHVAFELAGVVGEREAGVPGHPGRRYQVFPA